MRPVFTLIPKQDKTQEQKQKSKTNISDDHRSGMSLTYINKWNAAVYFKIYTVTKWDLF